MTRLTLAGVLSLAALLRAVLLVYGLYQDRASALPYTDIDYHVFTSASRYLSRSRSPYERETYRYTPLLAYLLYPTTLAPQSLFFHFGKALFALGDLAAGWMLYHTLRVYSRLPENRALWISAAVWLANPMVATISTRGSSEGLLGVLVMALLWATLARREVLSGVLLGLAAHFKLYPAIYGPAILYWMEPGDAPLATAPLQFVRGFVTRRRMHFVVAAAASFMFLNAIMYALYGMDFVQHTFLHHVSRLDHRHNFSVYNILLYLVSSPGGGSSVPFASIAFVPQMLLAGVLVPLVTAKTDLAACMFVQTFAFVGWNKVCTSQYFMWYLILLPFILPYSGFVRTPWRGVVALGLWALAQAAWLSQGYVLEFLGQSSFFPGLWVASLGFFGVNCWLLGEFVEDIKRHGANTPSVGGAVVEKK